jgi:hypothetical protein
MNEHQIFQTDKQVGSPSQIVLAKTTETSILQASILNDNDCKQAYQNLEISHVKWLDM